MQTLTFEYDKFGTMTRLVTLDIPYNHIREHVTGATESKRTRGKVTFPPDEILARRIIRLYPEIKVDARVTEWLNEEFRFNQDQVELKSCMSLDGKDEKWAFQTVDVEFMKRAQRCINGNEMGTGKTIESIKLADAVDAEKVLVVCSKSKMGDWEEEIEKWSHGKIVKVSGTPKLKQKRLAEDARWKIVTYGALRDSIKYAELFLTYWDCIFIDEAHRIRNLKSQQGTGATKLRSLYMIPLTGTAIYNKLPNLFALLHLLDPQRWGSYWNFVERFCETEDGFGGHPKVLGVKNAEVLQYILAPIMLDRKKKDVLPWLPEKIFKTIYLELDGKHQTLYKKMEKESMITIRDDEYVMAPTRLAQMTKLRQLALSPILLGANETGVKTDAILELIEEAIESDQKVVIMSCFREYVEYLTNLLNTMDIGAVSFHGELSENKRDDVKRRFKNDPNCRVFVATIQTAGEGLNLQHASMLIFSDPSIIPGEVKQAIERLDRDGQLRNPLIVNLICKNTIEEDISQVLSDKNEVVDKVMAMEAILKKFCLRT